MEEIHHRPQQIDSGAQHRQPTMRQRLPDVPACKLGQTDEINGFDATESEFLHFVQTLVPLTGKNLDQWTWEERRVFLNWCLDEGVLTIQDGRLVPVEEPVPTAPFTHDSEAVPSTAETEKEA